MRETLEQPGTTAALVTPDRALARRVAAELARWEITVDDSAGLPLLDAPPALFVRLLMASILEDFAPFPLLGLLKHPRFSLLPDWTRQRRAITGLERWALRGARPAPGIASLKASLAQSRDDAKESELEARALASELVNAIEQTLVPLTSAANARHTPADWVSLLTDAADACSKGLWTGPAGEALASVLEELSEDERIGDHACRVCVVV